MYDINLVIGLLEQIYGATKTEKFKPKNFREVIETFTKYKT